LFHDTTNDVVVTSLIETPDGGSGTAKISSYIYVQELDPEETTSLK